MDPVKFKDPKYIPDQSVEIPSQERMDMAKEISIG